MLLRNVFIVGDPQESLKNILIEGNTIQKITSDNDIRCMETIDLNEAIAFPGLINSHDHLDFNLFPQLGYPVYQHYAEWAKDIHTQDKTAIDNVLKIPSALRTQWGLYKNLLNGVTTVVNHGKILPVSNSIVSVFQESRTLHSIAFERNWKWKLNRPYLVKKPFAIHIGEGTNHAANKEISQLLQWNWCKRNLIGIHGVAMTAEQATGFNALVWCPVSNQFLFTKTATVDVLKRYTHILLGSDSTLTAEWNFWNHIRFARKTGMLTDNELFQAITNIPASVWGFRNLGRLATGQYADIVIAKPHSSAHASAMNAFYNTEPDHILLVIQHGEIRLFDETIHSSLKNTIINKPFSKIKTGTQIKYVIGDLPGLIGSIKKYYPSVQIPVSCC